MLSLDFARSRLLAQLGSPLVLASSVTTLRTTLEHAHRVGAMQALERTTSATVRHRNGSLPCALLPMTNCRGRGSCEQAIRSDVAEEAFVDEIAQAVNDDEVHFLDARRALCRDPDLYVTCHQ